MTRSFHLFDNQMCEGREETDDIDIVRFAEYRNIVEFLKSFFVGLATILKPSVAHLNALECIVVKIAVAANEVFDLMAVENTAIVQKPGVVGHGIVARTEPVVLDAAAQHGVHVAVGKFAPEGAEGFAVGVQLECFLPFVGCRPSGIIRPMLR